MRQTNPLPGADRSTGITPQGTTYSISGNKKAAHRACSTLVFIHGVGLNKAVWQSQIEAFSSGFNVIAYDLLGHGDSPLPSLRPTLRDYAAQLVELMDHLGLRQAHIVGHSMGALISIAFALAYAHRAYSVIAMNIVYKRNAVQREAVLKRAEAVLQSNQIDGIELALQRWFEKETGTEALQKIARVRRWMKQANPTGYGRSYQLFALSDRAFAGRLDQLSLPVLYLTGEKDANSTPGMSLKMAAGTPLGQAVVLENEAHMMAYIHPEKINPLVRHFLEDSSSEVQS